MTFTPIPQRQAELLAQGTKSNASLFFSRMAQWTWNSNAEKLEAKYQAGRNVDSSIVELGREMDLRVESSKMILDAIHARQAAVLASAAMRDVMVWEFRARLQCPYVSGLGSGHPTETGMILDRNSGLPYIPASAVKGVLRLACALHIAATEPDKIRAGSDQVEIPDDHPLLRRCFGDTDTGKPDGVRGQLVFLDAFPADVPTIRTDIMNPHFGKYYAGSQGPLETENPIPVKFLTVAEGAEFVFRCFVSPLPDDGLAAPDSPVRPLDDTDGKVVAAMFSRACKQLGFGAKTAVGYGRFALTVTNTTKHFKNLAAQEAEKRRLEEEARRQAKIDKQYPWRKHLRDLDTITEWGDLRQKKLDDPALREYQAEQEVAEKISAAADRIRRARKKKWKQEWDAYLQDWLTPAGVAWLTDTAVSPPPEVDPTLSAEERAAIERIDALMAHDDQGQKWAVVKEMVADLDRCSKPVVQKLAELCRKEQWAGKRAKPEKKEAAARVTARLRQLK
jgi:CRISPR-associated protein Cmr6